MVAIVGSAVPAWTLCGAVPGQSFVGPDGVQLNPVGVGFADQVQGVLDRFAVEPLVLQRLGSLLADAVLARRPDAGSDVPQLGAGGDARTESGS